LQFVAPTDQEVLDEATDVVDAGRLARSRRRAGVLRAAATGTLSHQTSAAV